MNVLRHKPSGHRVAVKRLHHIHALTTHERALLCEILRDFVHLAFDDERATVDSLKRKVGCGP